MRGSRTPPATTLHGDPSSSVPRITVDTASDVGINASVPVIRIDTNYSNIPQITLNEDGPVTPPNRMSRSSLEVGESSGYSPVDSPTGNTAFGFAGVDPFADDGLRQRGPGRRTPPYGGTPNLSPSASPMISPTTNVRIGPDSGAGLWYGGGLGQGEEAARQDVSREGSDVAPQVVLEALDDSEWRDQIRSFIEGEMGGAASGRVRSRANSGAGSAGTRSPR